MRARARLRAELGDDGRTRLVELRSAAPLLLRPTPGAVYLVGGAGGPVAGDDLALAIEVGPGAHLVVRSAAATLLHPGPPASAPGGAGPSILRVEATVAAGATLDWRPEPTVALAGCDHRASCAVELAGDAALWWTEDLVLGRHGERPGRVASRFDATRAGRPLLRHQLDLGPGVAGWDGEGGLAGARRVLSTLTVAWAGADRPAGERIELDDDAAWWVETRGPSRWCNPPLAASGC